MPNKLTESELQLSIADTQPIRTVSDQDLIATREVPILSTKEIKSDHTTVIRHLKMICRDVDEILISARTMRLINRTQVENDLKEIVSRIDYVFRLNKPADIPVTLSMGEAITQQINFLLIDLRSRLEETIFVSMGMNTEQAGIEIQKFVEEIGYEHTFSQREFLLRFYLKVIKEMLTNILKEIESRYHNYTIDRTKTLRSYFISAVEELAKEGQAYEG